MRRILESPVVRRILAAIGTLIGVAVLVFIMLRALPGDQIQAAYGIESAALSPQQREALEAYYGIDQPLFVQFFTWAGQILTGNLGVSTRGQQTVASMTLESLPVTFELAILSILVALIIGVGFGVLAASAKGRFRDWLGQGISLLGLGVPTFLLGAALLAIAAQLLGFNPNGLPYAHPWENPLLNLNQMFIPALVLGFSVSAPILRTTRASFLEVSNLDFVRTARAKGISLQRVRWNHVLRNASLPIVTMTGMQFGFLLGGAVVIEQIFSLPGLGRQVLLAINQKDFAVVQSTVLIIALLFVLVNLATDLLYRRIDPRVRAE